MNTYVPVEMRKFVAPEFLFGAGSIEMIANYIRNLGVKKVMLVTDPGVISAGWASLVGTQIEKASVPHIVFSDVSPNPRDTEVMKGAELYEREKCDMIVAVGGGSPMDCAKGIGIVSINRSHILEFEGVDRIPLPGPPLICVPTTSGTAADISQFSIILDTRRKVKIAIVSKSIVPDASLIDPVTTTTMSPKLAAETGMDALVHAIEAYVSNAASPFTDTSALRAIRLITESLPRAVESGCDLRYMDQMMLGSTFAGLAFSNASLGLVHAMAHSLGGARDLPHGECNALLLEHVVAYNFESVPTRYGDILGATGIDTSGMSEPAVKDALLGAIHELRAKVGIGHSLAAIGVNEGAIPALAATAADDACAVTNPREPSVAAIEEIFRHAL